MLRMSDDIGRAAAHYLSLYGERAYSRLGDDISRAIGRQDWDEAHRLQGAQIRVRRIRLCEQITERLELSAPRCGTGSATPRARVPSKVSHAQ